MANEERTLFKIGEVCRLADVQPYVLRYWETEFAALAPGKSGGGQRLYTQREIDIILRIKELLYTEGFTIAGAKKKLEVELRQSPDGVSPASKPVAAPAAEPPRVDRGQARAMLGSVRSDLKSLLEDLEKKPGR